MLIHKMLCHAGRTLIQSYWMYSYNHNYMIRVQQEGEEDDVQEDEFFEDEAEVSFPYGRRLGDSSEDEKKST